MKVEDQKPETLKVQLNKTKRIMQVFTLTIIVMLVFLMYWWLTENESLDSNYPIIIIALSLVVIALDKKYKKIKVELESRE